MSSAAAINQPTLVFSHANGFPAGVYSSLFEVWRAAGWRVLAVPKFGHNPNKPVAEGWSHLRDELLELIDGEAAGGPVALVGHSLGGYLSILAASHRPGVANQIVLLDSPLVGGWRSTLVGCAKAFGLMQRFGPGHIAARRRQHWASREQASSHLRRKAVFAAWDGQAMQDYLDHGLSDARIGQSVQLAFNADIERRLYNSLPHRLPRLLRKKPIKVPVHFIAGRESEEMRMAGRNHTRKWVGARWHEVDGGHLFPMEHPEATARLVLACLGGPANGS